MNKLIDVIWNTIIIIGIIGVIALMILGGVEIVLECL